MKRDLLIVLLQFILVALYFIDFRLIEFGLALPAWMKWVWLSIGVTGIVVILMGILHLNENLSPFPTPKRNSKLVSHGIYKRLRHPIYSGILLALLAYSCYSDSIERLFITFLLAIVFYYKSALEEKLLSERFPEYEAYKRKTGRFFPK